MPTLPPRPRYPPEAAGRLAFVHLLHARLGLPLARAYALAREALAAWPEHKVWEQDVDDTIALRVDLEHFLSACSVRLSLSRAYYGEKRRGRPRRHVRHGIAGARDYGVDISLVEQSLRRTPEERLSALDAEVEALRSLRVVEP